MDKLIKLCTSEEGKLDIILVSLKSISSIHKQPDKEARVYLYSDAEREVLFGSYKLTHIDICNFDEVLEQITAQK